MLSSAYVIGMLCLMAQMHPQSFGVGRTVNITNDSVSSASKKQYHHFFPTKCSSIKENSAYKDGIESDEYYKFLNARSRAMYNKLCGYVLPCAHDLITDSTAF